MATKKEIAGAEVKVNEAEEMDAMRLVTIHLFKDSGRYKEDVTVGLNGKFWRIKRGVDVEVPWAVAELLRHTQKMREASAEFIMQEEERFREAEKRLS